MNKMFVISDSHIPNYITMIKPHVWKQQETLTKDDNLVICGDVNLIFDYEKTGISVPANPNDTCWSREEIFWYEWLNQRRFTTLWIDGNHENFNRLATYPIEEWHGGRVHKISDSIMHLMRGEIYEINGMSVFAFGGAISRDRGPALGKTEREKEKFRAEHEGKIWWAEEKPSQSDRDNALCNLAAYDNKVDIIVTHEAPSWLLQRKGMVPNEVSNFLQQIWETTEFKQWFCGHHHINEQCGKLRMLFDDIVEVEKGVTG